MLTKELRPKTLNDVDGQPFAVDLLKHFAENPDDAPKCLLLHGPYGVGKTCAAEAFAYAVNNVDELDEKSKYKYISEYNCASLEYDAKYMEKSVEEYLEECFSFGHIGWAVIILDEIQGARDDIQTCMLKLIERGFFQKFFIFCTTELNKVLPTLRSRCLPIEFKSISHNDVYKNLDDYGRENGLDIPDKIKSHIATRCNGHMRDAHIELQKYLCVGENNYIANATSYYGLIANMFMAAHKGDKDSLVKHLKELSFNPLFIVKKEFDNFIIDCGNAKYLEKKSHISEVNMLLDEYGDDFTSIVDFYTGIWDNSLFSSDRHFYMHMLSFSRT